MKENSINGDIGQTIQQVRSLLESNDYLTLDQIESQLRLPRKRTLEALKSLEKDGQVSYSKGKWQAIEQ